MLGTILNLIQRMEFESPWHDRLRGFRKSPGYHVGLDLVESFP